MVPPKRKNVREGRSVGLARDRSAECKTQCIQETFVVFVDAIDKSHRTTHCGNNAPAGMDRGPRGPHESCYLPRANGGVHFVVCSGVRNTFVLLCF